ncbi:MAG: Asp-tRNA(Asn)/Glu-tRNA(Gln) amidotransferase subunit GatB [Ignavibacteria bacterium]|nr:Asp-tRNA(Asn)/Glu-tRNA(Gln) amidotransferase subunit GatB [Ignavibacteria bacterium]
MKENYEAVIGLEVHAQLKTKTKAFCSCTIKFGNEPNSNVCPVCLGMPGTLPVLNKNLVEFILRMGLITYCKIRERSIFARKNYFYPDLPKGYQISQYEEPICEFGFVEIESDDGVRKKIGLTRIHMEEDAGKLIHDMESDSLVDVNRCGTPLIEIVSEPDLRSAKDAARYLQKIHQLVTYLEICDGNMEEGSLRCDANVSIRKKGETKLGTKAEVKNMNSFRNVERAIEYEICRQTVIIESGGKVVQETLLWDAEKQIVNSMRSKEEAHDYRYFPDPDLVPIVVDEKWLAKVKSELPEHPTTRRARFISDYGLPKYDADVLTQEKHYAEYFENALAGLSNRTKENIKSVSNWIMTNVLRVVSEKNISFEQFPIAANNLGKLVSLIDNGTISNKLAKEVFEEMLKSNEEPNAIVQRKGLVQVSDSSEIEKIVREIVSNPANAEQVQKYRSGNEKVLAYFVGEIMKATKGKANPKIVNEVLRKYLSN